VIVVYIDGLCEPTNPNGVACWGLWSVTAKLTTTKALQPICLTTYDLGRSRVTVKLTATKALQLNIFFESFFVDGAFWEF
jgi:hypothetical protein